MIILDEKDIILQQFLDLIKPYSDYEMEDIIKEQVPKILEPYLITAKEETTVARINDNNEKIIQNFIINRKGRLADNTIKQYVYAIRKLANFYDKPLTSLNKKDIELYLSDYLSETKCSNNSLNTRKNYISAFYIWMKKQGLIDKNPCEGIENYKVVKKPVEFLTATEWDQLKTGCTIPRDRALLEFLRSTAMRIGEVKNIKINDVNWQSGEITIFGQKNQKYRTVFLDSVALKYLEEYVNSRNLTKESGDYLFVKEKKNAAGVREQITDVALELEVKNIGMRAGFDRRIYPHLLRKTTATNIIKRGGSEAEAGLYLGHSPVSVTGKYYIGDTKDEVEKIFKKNVATIQ